MKQVALIDEQLLMLRARDTLRNYGIKVDKLSDAEIDKEVQRIGSTVANTLAKDGFAANEPVPGLKKLQAALIKAKELEK
jgi:hypothetical protein